MFCFIQVKGMKQPNCADVALRNYSLTHAIIMPFTDTV